jgi:hypothetical protein
MHRYRANNLLVRRAAYAKIQRTTNIDRLRSESLKEVRISERLGTSIHRLQMECPPNSLMIR